MAGKALVPVVETFSTEALERHVKNKIRNNPLTLFPPIVGLLGVGVSYILGHGFLSVWAIAGYIAIVFGPGNFMMDKLFRRDKYWHDYIKMYNRRLKQQSAKMEGYLEPEFRKLDMSVCAEQVIKLRRFYDNFKIILGEKFSSESSIHDRYLGVAEGLYVGALGKLQTILSKHRSAEVIDPVYINGRLKELNGRCDTSSKNEVANLCNRLDLKKQTVKEIQQLIEEVETAISGLAELSAKVAAISDVSKDEAFDKIQSEAIRLAKDTHLFTSEKQI